MLQIVIQNVSCFSCCVPTTSPALHLSHSAGLDSPLHSVMRYRYSLYTSPTVQTLTAFCTPLFVIVIRYTPLPQRSQKHPSARTTDLDSHLHSVIRYRNP